MKNIRSKLLSLTLVSGILLSTVTPALAAAQSFTDVEGHWGVEAIEYVVEQGIFKGTSETTFAPDMTMTRGMFVTALGNLANGLNYDITGWSADFQDIDPEAYYGPYVGWATANKVVNGYGDGLFGPDDNVTREQMCVMTVNFLKNVVGADLAEYRVGVTFSDGETISDYALESVTIAQNMGIVKGSIDENGTWFKPLDTATRAVVATVFQRLNASLSTEEPGEVDPVVPPDGGTGGGVGGGGDGEDPVEPSEPTEAEREEEALVAQYLENFITAYANLTFRHDQEVKDCMAVLLGCIEDALDQRSAGTFLSREYIQDRYTSEIEELKTMTSALTEDQEIQLNNVILRLEEEKNIMLVMEYFGVEGNI